MVLTNIELWAADGSTGSVLPLDFGSNNPHTRQLNPFDPRVVPQLGSNLNHLSSNGYYGYSYVNAAHDIEINNNNNNNSNINRNNYNSTTYNLIANDVNDMNGTFTTTTVAATQQAHASSVNCDGSAYAGGQAVGVPRCKKRFFVMNDNDVTDCTATNEKNYNNNCEVSAKRCRFDDDFSAQYCNDFFQLPSTQIATQSCLMDTEEGLQQQQNHQVQADVGMFEDNNNNIEKYEQKLNPQLQTLSAHQHQQHSQQQLQLPQLEQEETQQQNLFHQQQHYQELKFATINCHFSHNHNSETLALNKHECKIDLEKNTENVLPNYNPNSNNSKQIEHDKHDNDVANKFKVDDATLFNQLHGGCLHHHDH